MLRITSVLCAAAAVAISFWLKPASDEHLLLIGDPITADKRILFIGNSFTYGGNVPLQVAKIAASNEQPVEYFIKMHVRGGTTLAEHISETNAVAAITSQAWDTVVLQDASVMAFRPRSKETMNEATTALARLAQSQGAMVLYYAHWAPNLGSLHRFNLDRSEAVVLIERAYGEIRQRVDGKVARAGRLWQMADDAGLRGLYDSDGHHASVTGAYVAALAITIALGDVDPKTSQWVPGNVDSAEHNLLMNLLGNLAAPELSALH